MRPKVFLFLASGFLFSRAPAEEAAPEVAALFGVSEALSEISAGFSAADLFRPEFHSGTSAATLVGQAGAASHFGILPGTSFVELSVGLGWQFGGELEFDPPSPFPKFTVDLDDGLMGKASLDFFPAGILGFGIYGQLADIDFDAPGAPDVLLWELGLSLKLRLPLGSLLVTPFGSLGYRRFEVSGSPFDSHGLALNAGVDVRVKSGPLEIFAEPGFLYMPVGALVEETEVGVTHDPIFYVLGGIGLAF